jgi:hypothetical protein
MMHVVSDSTMVVTAILAVCRFKFKNQYQHRCTACSLQLAAFRLGVLCLRAVPACYVRELCMCTCGAWDGAHGHAHPSKWVPLPFLSLSGGLRPRLRPPLSILLLSDRYTGLTG